MTLFLLPTERRNEIRVKKGKFFDECVGSVSADMSVACRPTCQKCVGRCVGSVSTDASVVCRPTRWPMCGPTRRWDRIGFFTFTPSNIVQLRFIEKDTRLLFSKSVPDWYKKE